MTDKLTRCTFELILKTLNETLNVQVYHMYESFSSWILSWIFKCATSCATADHIWWMGFCGARLEGKLYCYCSRVPNMTLDWISFLVMLVTQLPRGSSGCQDKGDGRQANPDYFLIECVYKTWASSKCFLRLFYALISSLGILAGSWRSSSA